MKRKEVKFKIVLWREQKNNISMNKKQEKVETQNNKKRRTNSEQEN